MRISDWSSDVCSSDLHVDAQEYWPVQSSGQFPPDTNRAPVPDTPSSRWEESRFPASAEFPQTAGRSEENTSELQSLMRTSNAVFCLKKKNEITEDKDTHISTRRNKTVWFTSATCAGTI